MSPQGGVRFSVQKGCTWQSVWAVRWQA